MKICKHCGNSLEVNVPTHYRTCESYRTFIAAVEASLTEDFLVESYLTVSKSALQISKELGLEKDRLVKRKLLEYGIPLRNASQRANCTERQRLTREVSKIRYGVDHHLKSDTVIQKRTETVNRKYGCDNVFQADDIKVKSSKTVLARYGVEYISQSPIVRAKVESTNMERYGVPNPWNCPTIQSKCLMTKAESGSGVGYVSKSSQRFLWQVYHHLPEQIRVACYFHELNKEFGTWDHTARKYFSYDFVIPQINYCLEYNGTYYHADPEVYQDDWFNKKLGKTAVEIWESDERKYNSMRRIGYEVDVVWQKNADDKKALAISDYIVRKWQEFTTYSNSQRYSM